MQVTINGQKKIFTESFSLEQLFEDDSLDAQWAAIAVNGTFVAKYLYASTYLVEGDQVEILQPAQGG
jgi:thiamine biosynthesis protein ThiS